MRIGSRARPRPAKAKALIERAGAVAALIVLGVIAWAPAACSLYRDERCYVDDSEYEIVYRIFIESGSLDVLERRLMNLEWRRCKINESIYRLEKEFQIVSRGAESATPVGASGGAPF